MPDIGQQRLLSPLKGRPRDAFEEFHMGESKNEAAALVKQPSKCEKFR